MTLLELVIAMAVVFLASSILAGTITATSRQRIINQENAAAADAVRSVIERMRNEDFGAVVSLYNADPFDDPNGPGTAPGNRFDVRGFDAPQGSPPGTRVGRVLLPILEDVDGVPGQWQLREDLDEPRLGMPRDLDGDGVVDDLDHVADVLVLPVRVEVLWQGRFGPRSFRMDTVLVEFLR